MRPAYTVLKNLVWLTQLGLSVISPLVLCIVGAWWLSNRYGIGSWIIIVGFFLGFGGAVSGFASSLRAMKRLSEENSEKKKDVVAFNDHK